MNIVFAQSTGKTARAVCRGCCSATMAGSYGCATFRAHRRLESRCRRISKATRRPSPAYPSRPTVPAFSARSGTNCAGFLPAAPSATVLWRCIPIVVPCHRVIGADSSLTGFGGGLERKRWLLAHEDKSPCCRETSPLATSTKSSKASRRAISARDDPVSSNTSS